MTLPHRYRRHRSPASLVKDFMEKRRRFRDPLGGSHTPAEWEDLVRHFGYWAFVRIRGGSATIHWWARPGIPTAEIAHMLGHELGHITGRRVRDPIGEEVRADAYGDVAREVFRRLTRRRPARAARRRGRAAGRSNRRASGRAGR